MKSLSLVLGAFACALAGAAHAQAPAAAPALDAGRFSLAVGGGTQGGSVEGAYSVNPYLTLRAQGAFIDFDVDFKSSDVKYKGTLNHNTGGGFVDLHPFANPFVLSGGFVAGERKVKVHADPTASAVVKINGVPYQASQIISVDGDIALGDTAPFAGIGFDNTYTHRGHWGFRAMAGVIFGDTPKVTLHANGPFADNATVLANLAAEQLSLQQDAKDYRYYPVAQVGVSYRF